jgi:hypothetical protein
MAAFIDTLPLSHHAISILDSYRGCAQFCGQPLEESSMMRTIAFGSGPRRLKRVLYLVAIAGASCFSAAFAAGDSAACSTNVEARQLDYWLGDWIVTYPGASGSGSSKVYLSLDQCLLVERWDSGTGFSGENIFAYNPEDKLWHGLYADNHAHVHVFAGRVKSGSAQFDGRSHDAKGEVVLNRLTVVRVTPNKVEQIWEKSGDSGATWKVEFRGDYSRKGL